MKIAIHHTPGSFSDNWLEYCSKEQIDYVLVNCYDADIIDQMRGVKGLMWHWNQNDYKSSIFALSLTASLEKIGCKVFPDFSTAWHFDDKLGQKYLFESLGIPFVNSYVFYTKQSAIDWINKTTFPKVFKLRGGASSVNVKLVNTKREARKLSNKAFGRGFSHINRFTRFSDRLWTLMNNFNFGNFKKFLAGFIRLLYPTEVERFSKKQKGYLYLQDFIPDNDFDTRLVVVGNKCFGMTRFCRKGDFRASGSNVKSFDINLISEECVKIAFESARKLGAQSVAFDFVKQKENFLIVEISYCFVSSLFPGYWSEDLVWNEGDISPQEEMVATFINSITKE